MNFVHFVASPQIFESTEREKERKRERRVKRWNGLCVYGVKRIGRALWAFLKIISANSPLFDYLTDDMRWKGMLVIIFNS